jgi:alkylation response protein AidB-like acyl-CoA dehydrogenase
MAITGCINGVKQFITSGKNADVAIVMAVTDKGAGKRGISAFLVPDRHPGYIVARLEDKVGPACLRTRRRSSSRTAACRRRTCSATRARAYKIALSGLEGGRIGIAAQAVGMARAAFEAALALRPRTHRLRRARSSSTRRCSSGWPTWPRSWRPPVS